MSGWAAPGVKCVFLGVPAGANPDMRGFVRIPDKDEVLTVRDICVSPTSGHVCLRFVEIRNPVRLCVGAGFVERAYEAFLFRPLISRSQEEDVAFFKRITEMVPG